MGGLVLSFDKALNFPTITIFGNVLNYLQTG